MNFSPLILNVGKAELHADWNYSKVSSPFARIYYVVSGEGSVEINGEWHTLHPGRMYIIPPFTRHSTRCTGEFTHYYIHLYEENDTHHVLFDTYDFPFEVEQQPGCDALCARLAALNPSMSLSTKDPQVYDNYHTLMQSILHNKQRPEWVKMKSRGIVYMLFSCFMEQATIKPSMRDPRIHAAIQYIHQNISNRITLNSLASEACLSPEHFIRLFSQTLGITPIQYINQKRMEKAQILLLTTDKPIKHISSHLGFADNAYFVRVFKNFTHVTPTEFRRSTARETGTSSTYPSTIANESTH